MFRDQKHTVFTSDWDLHVWMCVRSMTIINRNSSHISRRPTYGLHFDSFIFCCCFFFHFSCCCCRFFLFNVFQCTERAHTQHVWVCAETYNKTCIFLSKVNTYYITYNIYSTRNRKWVHDVGHLQRSFVCVIFLLLLLFPFRSFLYFLHARIRFVLVFFFFLNTNLYNWCIKANNLTILYAFTAET